MNFNDFLNKCLDKDFWNSRKYFCFEVISFVPILFFKDLFLHIFNKKVVDSHFEYVKNVEQLFSLMRNGTIFQDKYFYWLSDSNVDEKILNKLKHIGGPYKIVLFTKKSDNISDTIKIPDLVDYEDTIKIIDLFDKKYQQDKQRCVQQVIKKFGYINLDFLCVLMRYFDLVKLRDVEQFKDYFVKMFNYLMSSSFSDINKAFFSGKKNNFFSGWSYIKDSYPIIFWINYWSEQIFRAYNAKVLLDSKKFVEAKKVSFGLPYTFLKGEYRLFSKEYLLLLHDEIYKVDFRIKRGSSFHSLELFFLKHFNNFVYIRDSK